MANSRYAGDDAWTEWFEICSVSGCSPEHAAALRAEIESAMYGQLVRSGFSRADAGGDDPVAFFDSYFRLKGSRDAKKPLKSYFAYRLEMEGTSLFSFVCGTLFGSASGRIHDIVIDWIASLKGWKPRTVKGDDGRRRLSWENAGGEGLAAVELADDSDPAAFIDVDPLSRQAEAVIGRISSKLKVEKPAVALLLYATAQDISITEPAVLEGLGVGKSRAYAVREKAMEMLERELRNVEGADDPLFGRVLLECCEAGLSPSVRRRLEAPL